MLLIVYRLCLLSRRKLHVRKWYCSGEMQQNADNSLDTFRCICEKVAEERSYLNKSKILQTFFKDGSNGKGFQGDTLLWLQMLIPSASQRVYNLQNKQMIKLFARLFACDQQDMHLDLEQEGDVSETLRKFFEKSKRLPPQKSSTLYLQDVDKILVELEQRTKEDEQCELLRNFCKEATELDLKMVIRLIKQDLRINAGARHILDAFGPFAYPAYQSSRDLAAVVQQFAVKNTTKKTSKTELAANKKLDNGKTSGLQIMTPISPMLANACKSVDEAFKKSPQGLYSEIKYDGERVQIHKLKNEFKFFSRNLKPVMEHKIKRFRETIPKAFPGVDTIILDSEIILVDTETGDLLPFGTLGAHKKKQYAKAEVCLFVFDCLLLNEQNLTALPFSERRKILENNIKPLKSYVQLSESKFLKNPQELAVMTANVLKANLEGVVLKDPKSIYQPGKRGWLKVKKDYLLDGQMADTADLTVLGAWYGSGKKGGILSIFLMGCYDSQDKLWKTVTKVHSGLDDATNEQIHEQLMKQMVRADADSLPTWLHCKKPLVPDFIAKNPKEMPIWEITGAEFTKSEAHTAAGISIRFPRITRLRDDKSWEQADDLKRLQYIFEASKSNVKIDLLIASCKDEPVSGNDINQTTKLNATPQKTVSSKSPSSSKKTVSEEKVASKRKTNEDLDVNKISPKKLKTDLKTETKSNVKQTRLNIGKKKDSDCFAHMNAFFQSNIADLKKLQEAFETNGGTLSQDGENTDLVFYADNEKSLDITQIRNKYKKSCRHLNINWLQESLKSKSCQPFPLYAMVLRTQNE